MTGSSSVGKSLLVLSIWKHVSLYNGWQFTVSGSSQPPSAYLTLAPVCTTVDIPLLHFSRTVNWRQNRRTRPPNRLQHGVYKTSLDFVSHTAAFKTALKVWHSPGVHLNESSHYIMLIQSVSVQSHACVVWVSRGRDYARKVLKSNCVWGTSQQPEALLWRRHSNGLRDLAR